MAEARDLQTAVAEWNTGQEVTGVWPQLPAFLKLAGRKVVLVGGGKVAMAKFAALRAIGARLTIVAPAIDPSLLAHANEGIDFRQREFRASDLDGAWFVVSAAPAEVNRQVAEAAERLRVFVNAVDDPTTASAFAAAMVRRGELAIAISTGGRAPALAALVREALEELLPEDAQDWLEEARTLREKWRAESVPMEKRRALLWEALGRRYGVIQQPKAEGS